MIIIISCFQLLKLVLAQLTIFKILLFVFFKRHINTQSLVNQISSARSWVTWSSVTKIL